MELKGSLTYCNMVKFCKALFTHMNLTIILSIAILRVVRGVFSLFKLKKSWNYWLHFRPLSPLHDPVITHKYLLITKEISITQKYIYIFLNEWFLLQMRLFVLMLAVTCLLDVSLGSPIHLIGSRQYRGPHYLYYNKVIAVIV